MMKLMKFDIKQLFYCILAGILIKLLSLLIENPNLIYHQLIKPSFAGLMVGILIQVTYKIFGSKIKNTMFWTNLIICIDIFVVLGFLHLLNIDKSSLAFEIALTLPICVLIILIQNKFYKLSNVKLDAKKASQLELNKLKRD